jgi:hypothetical protein
MFKPLSFLPLLTFFAACGDFAYPSKKPAGAGEKLDTLKDRYPVQAKPYIFETAFFPGTADTLYNDSVHFYAVDIGKVRIESGKIIAADPAFVSDAKPFAAAFPIGEYSVQLAIAKFKTNERIAFSRILFSPAPISKWELALDSGQQPLGLYDTSYYGYPVDAGLGMFIDSIENISLDRMTKDTKNWEDIFITQMEKHSHLGWDYLLFDREFHSFAAFSSGWGDGRYGSYIGYDSTGRICRLLTDFQLIDWYHNP